MSTIADLMIDALRRAAIDTLFCLPGVQNDDFFDALVDAPDIEPIVTRHEQGAAYMAMGAAQATGRPAAFCVVPGPGMLNATAALTSAYWGGARVLGIIGAVPTHARGRQTGILHDLPDPAAVLRQVTKHTTLLDRPDEATARVQEALDTLVSDPPRPVTIEVPVDRWRKDTPGELRDPTPVGSGIVSVPDPMRDLTAVIAAAERPLIVVGSGAYDASKQVIELVELLGAPVFTRRMGHGVVPSSHRLCVPLTTGYKLWADADVVIGIGTRMEFPLALGVDDDLQIVHINIDPDEIDRHGIGAIGVVGDAAETLTRLLERLARIAAANGLAAKDREDDLARARADADAEIAHLEPQRSYVKAIREAVPDDGIIVEDVTQIGFACHLLYDHRRPRTFLASGGAGTLGAAVAVGIGAQHAVPDRRVLTICGDGGFLFTANEMATAVQHDTATTIVVFNDSAYGNVRRFQKSKFGADRQIASKLQNPDLIAFTESFGVMARRVDSPETLLPALEAALGHPGPALVEVTVGEMPDPWPFLRPPPVRFGSRQGRP